MFAEYNYSVSLGEKALPLFFQQPSTSHSVHCLVNLLIDLPSAHTDQPRLLVSFSLLPLAHQFISQLLQMVS